MPTPFPFPHIVTLLFLSTLFLPLGSCKKGKEDPFLSLRSRNARLTGTWELVAKDEQASRQVIESEDDEEEQREWEMHTTFDGNEEVYEEDLTITDPDGETLNAFIERVDNLAVTLAIEKEGSYSLTVYRQKLTFEQQDAEGTYISETFDNKSETRSYTGRWYWANNRKKKQGLILDGTFHKAVSDIFGGNATHGINNYDLLELSNSQMQWRFTVADSTAETDGEDQSTTYYTATGNWTWQKQAN